MKKLSTNEIRSMWLEFFKSHDHYIEESKSLIPVNDKSLLFINSGVATLKKYFSGIEVPPKNRIANAQRSIRTNDIENVGITSRHHTLFEMLGNFSIGDYFKKEAIDMMFEIMFDEKWFDFDIKDFYFTIHPNDQESLNILKAHNVKENRIVKLEENFWEIGEGPGGPNLEIFYDRGEKYDLRDPYELLLNDIENDRVIEVWNIVFSQYNCQPGIVPKEEYQELPQKNIDTGMGLERMACIMQEVDTNFETDNFMYIINELENISQIKYAENKMPFRVIADHIRALTFSLADGVIPSNEGRGYVIRRILRRASKYGFLNLNLKEPFLYKLVQKVVQISQPFYDYLIPHQKQIEEIIKQEEQKFLKTLESGIKEFNKLHIENKIISGENAFKLYDTYGFPIELTIEIANENNMEVDYEGFKKCLAQQQERARASIKNITAINKQNGFLKEIDLESEFIGYDILETDAKVILITDLNSLNNKTTNEYRYLLLDKNPFYAESGGQVADRGYINDNPVVNVTKLPNGQHLIEIENISSISINDEVIARVDKNYRQKIAKNHSATHLLHFALQKVLGKDAKQAGSYQDSHKTRFDFFYPSKIEADKILEIENLVNQLIAANQDVKTKIMSLTEAKEMGAMSLFEDKYADEVRVVSIGDSVELCGGTHVKNSSEIEYFKIIMESSVGSGIRRIEAVTSKEVEAFSNELLAKLNDEISLIDKKIEKLEKINIDKYNDLLIKYQQTLSVLGKNIDEKFNKFLEKIQDYKNNYKKLNNQVDNDLFNNYDFTIKIDNDIRYIFTELNSVKQQNLRTLADELSNKNVDVVILINKDKPKSTLIVKSNIPNQIKAKDVLQTILANQDGKGGGKDTFAQGSFVSKE